MEPVLMSWSGGKDSAMALREMTRARRQYRVAALLTTIIEQEERVPIQNIPRSLIERQAASLELPLHCVAIPKNATNREYEDRLRRALEVHFRDGVRSVVFGDIFLADIRAYREALLAGVGMRGLFPLWRRDTAALIREFTETNHRAVITSVDARRLDQSFAGRAIDEQFPAALPPHVDPCGENGEFHSFVFDGPLFTRRVQFQIGDVSESDGHYFCDLLPG